MPGARPGFPALHAAIQLYEAGEGVSAGLARANPARAPPSAFKRNFERFCLKKQITQNNTVY
jgi:hypothetical protein